jgi:hypothetical protein
MPSLFLSYASSKYTRPDYLCNTSLFYAIIVSIAISFIAMFMWGTHLAEQDRINQIRRFKKTNKDDE